MHAVSHSLAHRGPGASRARPRWQPYSSSITPSPAQALRPSPQIYLNTPASIVTPSPPSTSRLNSTQLCHTDRPRRVLPNPSQTAQIREALKTRYVTRLVDQAVNSLCDIWHPDDIPTVFRTSSRTPFSVSLPSDTVPPQQDAHTSHRQNSQLPSPPISPSSQSSSPYPTSEQATSSAMAIDESSPSNSSSGRQLLPMKGFVHEVLRRSRTSTGVLQTALCYLEAIRGKVPEILQKERSKAEGADQTPEADAESRIIVGEDYADSASMADATSDSTLTSSGACFPQDDIVPTIRVEYPVQVPMTAPPTQVLPSMSPDSAPAATASSKVPSAPLPPMPPLPSPLLCPRRTFLACLILASKFMQDRSYSNRAWAKLAGLPPREIGRCERALGEALEWRLWVGKVPTSPSSIVTAPAGPAVRPVTRCRSEYNINFGVGPPAERLLAPQAGLPASTGGISSNGKLSGLRRSATVPTLGGKCAPIQDPFVQHSLFLASKLFDEPESYLPETNPVDSPAAMSVSPPTMYIAPPPPAPASLNQQAPFHPPSYVSMSHLFAEEFSPSTMSTPGLSYSPMSTASTSSSEEGERTIQVSSLMDLPTPHASTVSPYAAKFDLASNATNTKPGIPEALWAGAMEGQGLPCLFNSQDRIEALRHTGIRAHLLTTGGEVNLNGLSQPQYSHPVPLSMPMVMDLGTGYNAADPSSFGQLCGYGGDGGITPTSLSIKHSIYSDYGTQGL